MALLALSLSEISEYSMIANKRLLLQLCWRFRIVVTAVGV